MFDALNNPGASLFKMRMAGDRIIVWIGLFFLVGIMFHLIPALSPLSRHITGPFLLAVNILVVIRVLRKNRRRIFIALFLGALIFTFLAEAAGVRTGEIFGPYGYGSIFKVQLLEVPLIIPLNWVILVLGMTSLAGTFRLPAWTIPFFAAFGLVLFDYTMEPVAVRLDYWSWRNGEIPIRNYLAWFIIGVFLSSATLISGVNLKQKIVRYYVLIQGFFFLTLNVFFRWFYA